MNDQDIKNIIKGLEPYINQKMKETVSHAKHSFREEDSNIAGEVKSSHQEIKSELQGINAHLKTLNGSVAKHTDKLAQNDIINAQTTMSLQQLATSLKEMKTTDLATLKKREEENSDFRKATTTTLGNFKWLVGAIGVGNLGIIIKLFTQ